MCRQPSPMSNASRMLQILDLDSLAHLTLVRVRYETKAIICKLDKLLYNEKVMNFM